MSSERRDKEIKRLNKAYLEVVADKKGLKESLAYMVETESYRWICKATYSLNPKSIRSERNFDVDSETNFIVDSVNIILQQINIYFLFPNI